MNTLTTKIAFLGILISFLGFDVWSQNPVTIKGKILDSASETPLGGATIFAAEQQKGALSDPDGNYSISLPFQEKLTLRVTYLGYDTVFIEVKPSAGETTFTRDAIMIEQGVMGEEVVITAGRHEQKLADVPISMEVIKPKAIDMQASSDIEDALLQSPGVDILDGQPQIRGSSGYAYGTGSRVMVMLNGLPLLSAGSSMAQFDMIPTDNITQIEIMKGAASVLYGSSAMGGVINVITGDAPNTPKTSVRFRQTIFDRPANKTLDWDGASAAFISSLNVFHSRKIKRTDLTLLADFVKNSGYRKDAGRTQGRFMAMTKFRPKKVNGMTLGVNASAKIDDSGAILYWDSYEPQMIPTNILAVNPDSVWSGGALTGDNTFRKQTLYRYSVDPFLKYLTPKGNVHNYRGRILGTINTNDTDQENRNWVYYNDYQFTTRIWKDRISWISGATMIAETSNADSLYGGKHLSLNGAIYTQMDAAFVDGRLNVSVGGRFDYVNIDGEEQIWAPIARLGVNYNTFAGNNIRASFGQAFRAPSIAERYTSTVGGGLNIIPNPSLDVERGYSVELGMRQGFKFGTEDRGGFGYIDVAGFMMDYNNMIEFGLAQKEEISFDAEFSATNIADVRIAGAEITALFSSRVNDFSFDLSGGVTFLDPVNKNPTPADSQLSFRHDMTPQERGLEVGAWIGGVKSDNPRFLKYRSRWTTRASLSLGYKKAFFTTNFQSKSNMESWDQFLNLVIIGFDKFVQERGGTHFSRFDFILGYDLSDQATVSFHVLNAFNAEYINIPGFLAEQRRFTVQVKYVF